MNEKKATLAAVCMNVAHDKENNLRKYVSFIERAGSKSVDLIAFPECSLQGYTWTWDFQKRIYRKDKEQQEYFDASSEKIPGPSTSLMVELAKEHKMYIVVGMAEKAERKIYNSAVLIGPKGVLGIHRKVHMAPTPIFSEGCSFSVFRTRIGKVGMVICADMSHPESSMSLSLQGARIIVNSTAWSMYEKKADPKRDPGGYAYDLVTRAVAYFNKVWLVSANQFGLPKRSDEKAYGHSRIVSPEGKIVEDSGYKEGLVVATINVYKGTGPEKFKRRRPESYRLYAQ